MKKYWIITQMFYPDETSTGYVMTKIAEGLTDLGKVSVICGSTEYQSSILKSNEQLNQKIDLIRILTPRLNKNVLLYRVIVFLIFTISVFFKIIFKLKKNDTLILVTNPPILLLFIGLLKKVYKFNFVIILQDIFPENALVSGIFNHDSFGYQLILKIMNFSYKKADKLIACGFDMAQHFINKGIDERKLFVIPNWADHKLITPSLSIDRNEYFNLNLSNKIVIEFAGNVGRVQGLEKFIKIFSKSTNKNLILIIIGDGANKKALEEYVYLNNLENVYFFKSKNRMEQNIFLNSCDIGLVTLCRGMRGLGVPSKVYNIMSAGKPILYIGDQYSEIDNYIRQNKIGWSFNWDEEIDIINFINKINCNDNIIQYGHNARNFILNKFTQEIVINQYKNYLN